MTNPSEGIKTALPVTHSDYIAGGPHEDEHRQHQAQATGQQTREPDAYLPVRQGVQGQRWLEQPQKGVPSVAGGEESAVAKELAEARSEYDFCRRAHAQFNIAERLARARIRLDRAHAALQASDSAAGAQSPDELNPASSLSQGLNPADALAGKVRELRDAQSASVGADPYMRGLYNGLELSLTVLEDRDPVYMAGPIKTDALHAVISERRRQSVSEGWTPEHDDEHASGELALAAACYAAHSATWQFISYGMDSKKRGLYAKYQSAQEFVSRMWPWTSEWWKPKDVRSNLVRAGALILAEIERLDRAAMKEPHQS